MFSNQTSRLALLLAALAVGALHAQTPLRQVRLEADIENPDLESHKLSLSPDKKLLLAFGQLVTLYDYATGHQVRTFVNAGEGFSAAVFAPDGITIAGAGNDGVLRLWNIRTGKELWRSDLPSPARSMSFSPDSKLLLSAGYQHPDILVWDAVTGRKMRSIVLEKTSFKDQLVVSADHSRLLTLALDGRGWLINLSTGGTLATFGGKGVTSVDLSADGQRVITTVYDKSRLWDAISGRLLAEMPSLGSPYCFTANSALISGRSAVIDAATGAPREDWKGDAPPCLHSEPYNTNLGRQSLPPLSTFRAAKSVWVSPDGRWLRAGGSEWELSTGRGTPGPSTPGRIGDALWINGDYAISSAHDNITQFVYTRSLVDGAWVRPDHMRVPLKSMSVRPLVSQNGQHTLAVSEKVAELWNMSTGTNEWTIAAGPEETFGRAAALSEDGSKVVFSKKDEVLLVDRHSGLVERHLSLPGFSPAVTISLDGQVIFAAGTESGALYGWDARTGLPLPGYPLKRERPITGLKLSLNARRLLSMAGGEIELLDALSGKAIRRFERMANFSPRPGSPDGSAADFTHDARFAFLVTVDGRIELIETETGTLRATMVGSTGTWAVFTPEGRFDTSRLDERTALSFASDRTPMQVLPIEVFSVQLFTPGLLARLLAGDTLTTPPIGGLNELLPEVTILNLTQKPDKGRLADVSVLVRSVRSGAAKSGVRDLRLFRNSHLVGFREGPVPLDRDGTAVVIFENIPLKADGLNNRFSAYAFNTDQVKSRTMTFSVDLRTPARKARTFLLTIGVNEIPLMPDRRLRFSVNDAKVTAAVLQEKLGGKGPISVETLISDAHSPSTATKAGIREAFSKLAREVRPEDSVIITFSGHGYISADEKFSIFPSDVRPSGGPLPDGAISSDELSEWLRPIDSENLLIILDACHSAASVGARAFRAGPLDDSGLGRMAYDKGISILAASQEVGAAFENPAIQQGLLTHALITEGLKEGKADWRPMNGVIGMGEWLMYGVRRVPALYDELQKKIGRGAQVVDQVLQQPVLFDFARRPGEDRYDFVMDKPRGLSPK